MSNQIDQQFVKGLMTDDHEGDDSDDDDDDDNYDDDDEIETALRAHI